MSTYDVGDQALLQHEVRVSGALTNATVVLSVTAPDGTATTPSVSHPSTGTYTATVSVDQAGPWEYTWTMSGAVIDVASGMFSAQNPATPVYATPDQVKNYVGGIRDSLSDARIAEVLAGVSRDIDGSCHRRFYADLTASARLYDVTDPCQVDVDDFWTTTGLVVEGDYSGAGTFTTLTASDYELRPLNGIVDGESGWPYNEFRAVNRRFPCQQLRAGMRVTAKWGWAAIPPSVREACLILSTETLKLPDSVFGAGGYSDFGIIKVRDNPMAARKLSKFVRDPVLVG